MTTIMRSEKANIEGERERVIREGKAKLSPEQVRLLEQYHALMSMRPTVRIVISYEGTRDAGTTRHSG